MRMGLATSPVQAESTMRTAIYRRHKEYYQEAAQ